MILKLYFIFVMIFSGYATSFFRSDNGVIFLFLLTLFIIIKYNVIFTSTLIKIIIIWTVYCFTLMIFFNDFFPGFYLRHLTYILITYTFVKLLKENFFYLFETYIYYFAIISLFFLVGNWCIFKVYTLLSRYLMLVSFQAVSSVIIQRIFSCILCILMRLIIKI